MLATNFLGQYKVSKIELDAIVVKLQELQTMKVMIEDSGNTNTHLLAPIMEMVAENEMELERAALKMSEVHIIFKHLQPFCEEYILLQLFYMNPLTAEEVCNRLNCSIRRFYEVKKSGLQMVQAILDAA